MDVADCSVPSCSVDCNQSQSEEAVGKMPQLSPKNSTAKSDDQKVVGTDKDSLCNEVGRSSGIQVKRNGTEILVEHKGVNGGKMSCLKGKEQPSSSGKASDDLLTDLSNFSKNEDASLGNETESTCPLELAEDKQVNESIHTAAKEIVSNIEHALDEFCKDAENLETASNLNNHKERKCNDVVSEGKDKKIHLGVSVEKRQSVCSKVKNENEAPNKIASHDLNLSLDVRMSAAEQRMLTPASGDQKNRKNEVKQKSDNIRPVGRLLHDLGLDLVREQVYKDLIGIQIAKDVKNMLDEKEKEQLKRLTDAHSKLIVKNAIYQLPLASCSCNYSSSSANVLALHHEFGSTFEAPFHTCCLCEDCKTRWPSQFLAHLESSHQRKGRVQTKLAPYICKYCPYEHKNQARMEAHVGKCIKKFNLNTNLQPLPADCDVPLIAKTSQSLRPSMMAGPSGLSSFSAGHGAHQVAKQTVNPVTATNAQPSVMEIGGQLYSLVHRNGKALFTSLRSQIADTCVGIHSSSVPSSVMGAGNLPRFVQPLAKPIPSDRPSSTAMHMSPQEKCEKCEMCDAVVKNRFGLWNHFRLVHKVELGRMSIMEKDPWITCDVCLAKFWTYQGLTRHSLQLHKRESSSQGLPAKAFKCFLCLQTQTNPLNHLSTFHNITLLDMYHSRRCCMCNKRFRTAPAFEEHMVLQHHDIFANKDVLCTVLQALSTALSLKRQETIQHRPSSTAATSKLSPRSSACFVPGSSGSVQSTVSSAALSFRKNSPEVRMPNKMPSLNKAVSPSKAPTATTGQQEAKKRRQLNEQSKGNDSSNANKTSPKKSNEEDAKELNKLYTEYADIGRPILRSMRHRLSRNSLEKVAGDSPRGSTADPHDKHNTGLSKSPNNASAESSQKSVETNLLEEPLPKRLRTENCINDTLNDSFHVNQQKQLQEVNGDVTNVAECQKTS